MQNTKFIVHVAFWIGCGIFAAYTTTLQFVRYYENEDTPKISEPPPNPFVSSWGSAEWQKSPEYALACAPGKR